MYRVPPAATKPAWSMTILGTRHGSGDAIGAASTVSPRRASGFAFQGLGVPVSVEPLPDPTITTDFAIATSPNPGPNRPFRTAGNVRPRLGGRPRFINQAPDEPGDLLGRP